MRVGSPLARSRWTPTPAAATTTRFRGIPALILFRDGKELARHEGALAKPQLQAFLDAHL